MIYKKKEFYGHSLGFIRFYTLESTLTNKILEIASLQIMIILLK